MKNLRILFPVLIAVIAMASCSTPEGYTVKGKLIGYGEESIYLVIDGGNVIDTSVVRNGQFIFKGDKLEHPQIAGLANGSGPFMMFFLDNGNTTIDGDFFLANDAKLDGSKANRNFSRYMREINKIQKEFYDEKTTEERRDELTAKAEKLFTRERKQNADNLFGVFILLNEAGEMNYEQVVEQIEKLSPEMQKHPYVENLEKLAKQYASQGPEGKYREIELPDTNGNVVLLSEFLGRDKYVLVDFWASWCAPCMGELPYLKQAYADYAGKGFEILGVSLDEDAQAWKNAVAQGGMKWPNVSSLSGGTCKSASDYGVSTIPTNFLIAPDGTIVASDLRGEELAAKLAELLK